jgi:hypothetical protein
MPFLVIPEARAWERLITPCWDSNMRASRDVTSLIAHSSRRPPVSSVTRVTLQPDRTYSQGRIG